MLSKSHRTDEGYLYFEGRATRAGVFLYRRADGTIRRELRPPEEVGRQDSLATLARKPVTDLHPEPLVTADNADEFAVGIVDPEVVWEADFADGYVKVRGTVQRASAVDSIDKGRVELSCGYTARIDFTPGVWVDANGAEHEYDSVQRDIEYNHLALVDRGRAGALARLRADGDDAILMSDQEIQTHQQAGSDMKTITIKGRVYSLDTELTLIQRTIADMEEAAQAAEDMGAEGAEGDKGAALMAEIEGLRTQLAELEVENADMAKRLAESGDAGMGEGEGEDPEMMSKADALDWAVGRIELARFADSIGVEDPDRFLAVDADDAALRREVALVHFDADDLPTDVHVDAAISLMRKKVKGAEGVEKKKAVKDGLGEGGRKLVGILFNRNDDGGEKGGAGKGEDEGSKRSSVLDAQDEYDKRYSN